MKQRYTLSARKLVFPIFLILLSTSYFSSHAQITLGSSPYTQDFNSIGSGLPAGWTVRTGATATALGTSVALTTGATSWGTTAGQFSNAASANSPSLSSDGSATQATRTDRALAVRQTGTFGDPGAAFVLQIANTTNLTSFTLAFKLMELDPTLTAGRTATWNIDYGFGASPAAFTNATTVPATLTTSLGGGWGITSVTVNFGSALDNNAGPVWIRLSTKAATSGSGSRPVSAIDDFSLAYNASSPALTAGALSSFGGVCINTTAGPNSFSLSGVNLNGSTVTAGPLAGYTFSETAGGSYTASVSPAYTAPTLSSTIYVKFSPTAIQSYSGNIPVSGGGASSIDVAAIGAGVDNPPTVTTGAASSIVYNGATLAGVIAGPGCSSLTGYGIEYSTSNGFANGSGTAVPASNLAGNNFSSAITGLSPNVTYYYHAYASNSAGVGYGSQQSFLTAQLNAPVATAASSITNNSFNANWNSVTDATGYRLDVATTSTFYAASTTPVAEWNFPGNPDDNVADGGIGPNLTRQINAIGATGTISYIPVASSATSAATGPGWDNGNGNDYWEINIVTAGYYNLKVSSAQRSSNTGPRDFKLQYKIGAGGTYADVPGGTVVIGNDWTTGVLTNISLPATCENKISVFLRWIMTTNTAVTLGTVSSAGTSGIDNISIIGNAGSFVSGYNNLAVAGLTQAVNTNLSALTTYYYRVRATGGSSTSDNSNVISVTTTCVAPQISACPSDIQQCDDYVANWTDPTATGDPAATVSCSPLSGSTFPAGVTTVTCTATNGCGSPSTCSFSVTIGESPSIGACPSDITDCNPVVTFADPTSTGTSPLVSCVPASGSTFPAGTTAVTCTASNDCGSSSCSFNVTINTTSSDPTSASSNANYGQICLGGNVTLSVNGGTLGTGASWQWYEGGCGSGSSIGTGPSITITPVSIGAHVYYVRAEGDCGNSLCASVTVNVISAPPSGTIHYTTTITDGCVSAPAMPLTVNAVPGAAFYRWTSAQAGVRFNGNPGPYETTVPAVNVSFVTLPAAGSSGWSICVFGSNACGNTNTICSWVRAIVGKPTAINGSSTGCPGATGQPYSSAFEPGAASYQWSATGGITINGNGLQSITVDFAGGFVSGTLSVHAQTSCGYNSADRTITITRAPAIPGIISGPNYPCPNASSVFSVTAVSGAANYTWSTSVPGAIVSGTTTNCSILFPASIPAGSTVSVTANSSCPFSSPVRSKGISSGIPNVPQVINGPGAGQCGQTGVSYSISPVVLATGYNWTISCGTIAGPTNLSGVTVDWPANFTVCTLSVSASNACGTGGIRTLGVLGVPAIPAAIIGNASPCANGVEVYSTAGSSGATGYTWTLPAGAVILGPANGNSILVQWGSASGNITVRATNSCGNSGARTLSCTISCRMSQVNASRNPEIKMYPNPAVDRTTLEISSGAEEQLMISITDATGRIVSEKMLTLSGGMNRFDFDLSGLSKGIYFVHADAASIRETIKLSIE
jgi:hypothetical protein